MSESRSVRRRWVETLTQIGVIVSLVLVALELRQTNAAIYGAAYQDLQDGFRDLTTMMAEDPERMEVWRRWWTEAPGDTLTRQEELQVHATLVAFFHNYESVHRQMRAGLITEDDAIAFFGSSYLGTPAFGRWWDQNTQRFSDDFVTYIEDVVVPYRNQRQRGPR